jgi:hypothetical protein
MAPGSTFADTVIPEVGIMTIPAEPRATPEEENRRQTAGKSIVVIA